MILSKNIKEMFPELDILSVTFKEDDIIAVEISVNDAMHRVIAYVNYEEKDMYGAELYSISDDESIRLWQMGYKDIVKFIKQLDINLVIKRFNLIYAKRQEIEKLEDKLYELKRWSL